jgi:hypothetical protein
MGCTQSTLVEDFQKPAKKDRKLISKLHQFVLHLEKFGLLMHGSKHMGKFGLFFDRSKMRHVTIINGLVYY